MKITHLIAVLAAVAALAPLARAQDGERKTDQVYRKMMQTDMLYNILPLVLTRAQVRQLLPAVEKARQKVEEEKTNEDKLLRTLEKEVDATYKQSLEKGTLPSDEVRLKFARAVQSVKISRAQVVASNIDLVYASFKKVLDAGQRKAAANSLNIKYLKPELKAEDITQEEKEKLYVQYILLDGDTYQVLLDLLDKLKD